MNIKKRLFLVIIAIVFVLEAGSIGYYILFGGKYSYIDCLYMTVISITGVGYGEVIEITGNYTAQVFTMILIILGMAIIVYALSTLAAFVIEGELSGMLRKQKMEKLISKMENHYIVCGGGETGYPLIAELVKNREQVVLLEIDEKKIERCTKITDVHYVKGDATDDENLIRAGIERASGIMICLPSDKDNIYVTMTARMLNDRIRIVSRMVDPKKEPKLKRAGADNVVSPNYIGALRMASEMIRPAAVDFLDRMLRSKKGNLRIHELTVSKSSNIAGKSLIDSGLKSKFGILVLGKKEIGEDIKFNPSPTLVLNPGLVLIIMGDVDDIARAKKSF